MASDQQYCMKIARLAATRSKDENKQVGACIVDVAKDRIISTGYNGFPWNCPDDEFPWAKNEDPDKKDKPPDPLTKDPYVCHAEYNAILNKGAADITGDKIVLYSTLHPCEECALFIIHSGIQTVKYAEKKFPNAALLFKKAGIKTKHLKANKKHVVSLREEDY